MRVEYGRPSPTKKAEPEYRSCFMPVAAILFFLGAVAGRYTVNLLTDTGIADLKTDAFRSLLMTLQFYVPAVVSVFFTIGLMGIPALLMWRGYILGCTAAVLYRGHDFLTMWRVCGIPALLQLPSLFLLCDYAFYTCIGRLRHDPYIGTTYHRNRFIGCLLYAAISLLLGALYELYI